MKIILFDMNMFQDDYELRDILFDVQDADVYDVFKFKDKFYAVSMVSKKRGFAGVREINYNPDGEEQLYESLLKCPYCGNENQDSWEIEDSSGERECGRCNSEYEYEREVSVSYSTYPKKGNDIKEVKD
jgi:hypothetical protein